LTTLWEGRKERHKKTPSEDGVLNFIANQSSQQGASPIISRLLTGLKDFPAFLRED